jgi:hypothetical protein
MDDEGHEGELRRNHERLADCQGEIRSGQSLPRQPEHPSRV